MASNFALEPAYKSDESDTILLPVAAGQTFITGALLVFGAGGTGTVAECGADPAVVTGLALAPASVGLAAGGSIYGGTNIPVLIIQPDMVLKISSATVPAVATHLGVAYGVVKSTYWKLDTTEVTVAMFVVVGISPVQGIQPAIAPEYFLVKMKPSFNLFSAILS